jgi:GcrA cell cycle regulator
MAENTWTEERIALLRKLALVDGLSSSQIVAALGGVTRNAVIGKMHRLGITGNRPNWVAKPKRSYSGAKPKPIRSDDMAKRVRAARKAAHSNPDWKPLPLSQERPDREVFTCELVDLGEFGVNCRWPGGSETDSPPFRFCGAAAIPGGPYCPVHSRMAHQSTPSRRISQPRWAA